MTKILKDNQDPHTAALKKVQIKNDINMIFHFVPTNLKEQLKISKIVFLRITFIVAIRPKIKKRLNISKHLYML